MKKIVSLCLMFAMSMTMWATKTLYLVPNSNWTQANAKFAVYYFGGTGSPTFGWSDFMTLAQGETNVYTTTIPDGYPTIIFCRMEAEATQCSWGTVWNQSADITLPTDGKDMCTLENGWNNVTGTWSTYSETPEPVIEPKATYYIKNNWNGGQWNWEQMEASNQDSTLWAYDGVFGGTGVNINTAAADAGQLWFDIAHFTYDVLGYEAQAGDTINFLFNLADTTLTAHLIGRPAAEPQPTTNYYIKNNWNGGEWAWEQMTPANDGLTYGYTGVFGGTGVNINTAANETGQQWFAIADFTYNVLGYEAQAGDTIQFVYAPADSTLTAILVGRPAAAPVVLPTVAVAGAMNSWSATADIMTPAQDSLTASITMTLNAEDCEFKVVVNGEWRCYPGQMYEFTRTNNTAANVVEQGGMDDNFKLKADVAGEYTFTWTYATNTLTVTFPEAGPQPATPKFYVTGGADIVGEGASWTKEGALISYADTFELNLAAGQHELKVITPNDQWLGYNELTGEKPAGVTTNEHTNIVFTLNEAGVVTIVYVANPMLFTIAGNFSTEDVPVVLPTVAVAGAMNSWSATADIMTPAQDSLTASITMTLNAEDCEFKVVVNGEWRCYPGQMYEFTRTNNTAANVVEQGGMDDNFKLKADVAGEYTFTWTYATNTLTVTFPEAGPQPATNYFIKNNWNGGEWAWEQMTPANDGLTYGYTGVFGGTGVNINTAANETGQQWFAIADFTYNVLGYEAQAGDTINFVYNPADSILTAILIGRPTPPEPVEMVEIRLVPGVWNVDGAKMAAVTWKAGETMEVNGVFSAWMTGADTLLTMIPADADSIAFGRFNPASGAAPDMVYLWNHTDKLLIDSSMIYTITAWAGEGEDCDHGYWGGNAPSALESISVENDATLKVFENGVLYIYRDGVKYNAAGQIIR